MLKLKVEGAFKIGYEVMKDRRGVYLRQIRDEEKKNFPNTDNLEFKAHINSVQKYRPINIDGIIVNRFLLQKFLKKLRGFDVTYEVTDFLLVLNYENRETAVKGQLVLENLAEFYEGIPDIPKGILYE